MWSSGRSPVWDLDIVGRKRAAIEGFLNTRILSVWTDTSHQPSDGGTRPDPHGRLLLTAPVWMQHRVVVVAFRAALEFKSYIEQYSDCKVIIWTLFTEAGNHVLKSRKDHNRFMTFLSSGHVVGVLWKPPFLSQGWNLVDRTAAAGASPAFIELVDNEQPPEDLGDEPGHQSSTLHWICTVAQGICIGHDHGAFNLVWSLATNQIWYNTGLVAALLCTSSFHCSLAVVGSQSGPPARWRLAGTWPRLTEPPLRRGVLRESARREVGRRADNGVLGARGVELALAQLLVTDSSGVSDA